jgi:hypothetical protein
MFPRMGMLGFILHYHVKAVLINRLNSRSSQRLENAAEGRECMRWNSRP